ncbi:sugar hydrolase, partial [Gordonia desulfuricans]|nr:sugar hydrolase [Gordonia desulfuricans]
MSVSDTTTPDPSNQPSGAADAATTPLPGAPAPAPMTVGAAGVPPTDPTAPITPT